MRVHERGSGETRSCGTGACAVMVAAASKASKVGETGRGTSYDVDLPGGTLHIEWTEDDRILMTGQAVLVAEGNWLAGR
jgi:diaminopimelate epimerase